MTDDLEQLQRWETSGGHWRVLSDDGTTLTVAMVTCDGGEEMARLVSAQAELRGYVERRDRRRRLRETSERWSHLRRGSTYARGVVRPGKLPGTGLAWLQSRVDRARGAREVNAHRVPAADRLMGPLVFCGVVGGFLHSLKGVVLLWGGPDLSVVPAMMLLFGLGLVALHRSVGLDGRWTRVGALTARLAVIFGAASVGCQLAGWQPEDPLDPVVVDVAYAGGTLAVLVGLLVIGVAWAREETIALPWRWVPLAVGVVWFPLESLTMVLPDGWGLALAGLSWVVAASTPFFATGRQAVEGPERGIRTPL